MKLLNESRNICSMNSILDIIISNLLLYITGLLYKYNIKWTWIIKKLCRY